MGYLEQNIVSLSDHLAGSIQSLMNCLLIPVQRIDDRLRVAGNPAKVTGLTTEEAGVHTVAVLLFVLISDQKKAKN
jgi:hypothetical protein